MTPVSISQEKIVKELDELLALAETSTAAIDTLIDTRQETLLRSGGYLLSACILVLAMGITSVFGKGLGLGANIPVVVLFLGLLSAYLAYALLLQYTKLKRAERDLTLERHIHGQMVSFLDEASRRMDSETLSTVARATIDIRMRRLNRGTV